MYYLFEDIKRIFDEYEIEFPEIDIKRKDDFVIIRPIWDLESLEKLRLSAKNNQNDIKNKILDKSNQLKEIFAQYDSISLLSTLTIKYNIEEFNPFFISEDSSIVFNEYAQSIALTQKEVGEKKLSKNIIIKVDTLLKDIFGGVSLYYGSEDLNKYENFIRYTLVNRYLFVRKDIYYPDLYKQIENIFSSNNPILIENLGFSSEDVIKSLSEIEYQFRPSKSKCAAFKKLLLYMNPKRIQNDFFRINLNKNIKMEFLNHLYLEFGDNRFTGFPTDMSMIYEKPIIRFNGEYYCFQFLLLLNRIRQIIEYQIEKKSTSNFNIYQKDRANYLEKEAIDRFLKLIPDAEHYSNLRMFKNNIEFGEADGLILHKNKLLILQAKAGMFHNSSWMGDRNQMEKDLNELINNAYKQGKKVMEYIFNEEIYDFRDIYNRNIQLNINKNEIKNTYIIIVTLEDLNGISTFLNRITKFGFVKNKEWPWAVSINDLTWITELMNNDKELFEYLDKRIGINDLGDRYAYEELNYYACYRYDKLKSLIDMRLMNKDMLIPLCSKEMVKIKEDYLQEKSRIKLDISKYI